MTHPPRFNYSGTSGDEVFEVPADPTEALSGLGEDRPSLLNGGAGRGSQRSLIGEIEEEDPSDL